MSVNHEFIAIQPQLNQGSIVPSSIETGGRGHNSMSCPGATEGTSSRLCRMNGDSSLEDNIRPEESKHPSSINAHSPTGLRYGTKPASAAISAPHPALVFQTQAQQAPMPSSSSSHASKLSKQAKRGPRQPSSPATDEHDQGVQGGMLALVAEANTWLARGSALAARPEGAVKDGLVAGSSPAEPPSADVSSEVLSPGEATRAHTRAVAQARAQARGDEWHAFPLPLSASGSILPAEAERVERHTEGSQSVTAGSCQSDGTSCVSSAAADLAEHIGGHMGSSVLPSSINGSSSRVWAGGASSGYGSLLDESAAGERVSGTTGRSTAGSEEPEDEEASIGYQTHMLAAGPASSKAEANSGPAPVSTPTGSVRSERSSLLSPHRIRALARSQAPDRWPARARPSGSGLLGALSGRTASSSAAATGPVTAAAGGEWTGAGIGVRGMVLAFVGCIVVLATFAAAGVSLLHGAKAVSVIVNDDTPAATVPSVVEMGEDQRGAHVVSVQEHELGQEHREASGQDLWMAQTGKREHGHFETVVNTDLHAALGTNSAKVADSVAIEGGITGEVPSGLTLREQAQATSTVDAGSALAGSSVLSLSVPVRLIDALIQRRVAHEHALAAAAEAAMAESASTQGTTRGPMLHEAHVELKTQARAQVGELPTRTVLEQALREAWDASAEDTSSNAAADAARRARGTAATAVEVPGAADGRLWHDGTQTDKFDRSILVETGVDERSRVSAHTHVWEELDSGRPLGPVALEGGHFDDNEDEDE